MTCPLGHEATHYAGTKAYPADRHTCHACRRDYVTGRDGEGRWLRQAGFCDGCDAPTWRMVETAAFGEELLWPNPATRFPLFRTPHGPGDTIYRDFCPACCPSVGEDPPRIIAEIDGAPIETAECVGFHAPPRERYAHLFTDERRRFLGARLGDDLGLPDEDRDRWLDLFDLERAGEKATALTESADG